MNEIITALQEKLCHDVVIIDLGLGLAGIFVTIV
jgi:hypothetical protein